MAGATALAAHTPSAATTYLGERRYPWYPQSLSRPHNRFALQIHQLAGEPASPPRPRNLRLVFAIKRTKSGATLSDILDRIDYEQLVEAELEAAAMASSPDQRRAHLDQAAVLAAEGETARLNKSDLTIRAALRLAKMHSVCRSAFERDHARPH